MRLEWIDDILAVLDSGSLAQAAEKRRLTQSAFTRRARTIEDSIGTTLFDRSRKPVSLLPGVAALEPDLRALSAQMHRLRYALKTSGAQNSKPLAFVCQHALTATISPQVVRVLRREGETSVRVRSGNQDECLMQLLSKEADFAIMYEVPDDTGSEMNKAFEAMNLGLDQLIPVCAPAMREEVSKAVLPVITYPSEVFLGQVFARSITPRLPKGATAVPVAETSLTLAMQQLAVNKIGIAWLPHSLVAASLAQGDLVRVDDVLPSHPLNIKLIRLRENETEHTRLLWRDLTRDLLAAFTES